MNYTLSIDVELYDEMGRETCHHRGVAIVTNKKSEVIGIAKVLYEIVRALNEDPNRINIELLYDLCHSMKEIKK